MTDTLFSAAEIYAAGHALLVREGWEKVEPDGGWWWHPARSHDELNFGQALDEELERHGIDLRMEPQL